VQKAGQVVAQALVCTAKGKLVPRDRGAVELSCFEAFIVAAHHASQRGRGVDNDDWSAPRVRVDINEPIEPDVQPAFLARFPNRGHGQRFAAIDVATWEDPFAVARLDRSPYENQPVGAGANDGADGNLRIEIKDEAAGDAHQPLGLRCLDYAWFQGAAAAGTEPVIGRRVVLVNSRGHHAT